MSKWASSGDLPDDCLVDANVTVSKAIAHSEYCEWCLEHDIRPPGIVHFGRDIKTVLPKLVNTRQRTGVGRDTVYGGLRVRPDMA